MYVQMALGISQPPIQRVLGTVSLVVKQQKREADHSSLRTAEIKDGRGIPPVPHTSTWRDAQLSPGIILLYSPSLFFFQRYILSL
jgi:hypothetical protein